MISGNSEGVVTMKGNVRIMYNDGKEERRVFAEAAEAYCEMRKLKSNPMIMAKIKKIWVEEEGVA